MQNIISPDIEWQNTDHTKHRWTKYRKPKCSKDKISKWHEIERQNIEKQGIEKQNINLAKYQMHNIEEPKYETKIIEVAKH